jgi:hypothetical protein
VPARAAKGLEVSRWLVEHLLRAESTDRAQARPIWPRPWGVAHRAPRQARAVYSTVHLINALEQEKAQGKTGRIASALLRMDLVILDLEAESAG